MWTSNIVKLPGIQFFDQVDTGISLPCKEWGNQNCWHQWCSRISGRL